MVNKRSIYKSGLAALTVKVLGAAASFFVAMLITRSLGRESTGTYFLVLSIIYVLWPISSLGLNNALLKKISQSYSEADLNRAKLYQWTATSLVIATSLCISTIVYLYSDVIAEKVFSNDELNYPIQLAVLSLPIYCLYSLNSVSIQSRGHIAYSMVIISLIIPLTMGVMIYLELVSDLKSLQVCYLIASFICFLFSLRAFSPLLSRNLNKIKLSQIYQCCFIMTALSFPMMISQLVIQGNAQISNIILGMITTPSDVAIFGVCLKISTLVSFVLTSVNRVVAPKFAVLYNKGAIIELKDTVVTATRMMVVVCTIPLLFLFFFGDYVLSLFGNEYIEGLGVLRILILSQFVNVFTGSVGYLLQMTGNQKILRNNVLIAFILGFLLSWPLISFWKVNGAAITSFIIVFTANVLNWWAVKNRLGVNSIELFRKIKH